MKTGITLILLSALVLSACQESTRQKDPVFGPDHALDSLVYYGANHYDIASYLFKNPESLDVPVNSDDSGFMYVETSPDGHFRVYSLLLGGNYYDVHNIFQYNDDGIYRLRVDADEWGYITGIGMLKKGSKTCYLLVTEYVAVHQGTYCTTMISAYSLDRDFDDSLRREPLFVTKSGRRTDHIEVSWDDEQSARSFSNYFGVSLDNHENTREVYIQVVDEKTGDALNQAIVYRWNGNAFTFSGIRPMSKEERF